jgi:hypothetical protein
MVLLETRPFFSRERNEHEAYAVEADLKSRGRRLDRRDWHKVARFASENPLEFPKGRSGMCIA